MTRYQSFSFILLLACSCVSVQVLPCGAVRVLRPGAHQEPRQPQVEEESSAAESYMRELYRQMADENGIPKNGSKFSSVVCFTGTAVSEDGFPEGEELCTSTAQFSFNLDSPADIQPITLQKGILRVYVQTKSAAVVELSARVFNSKTASVVTQATTTKGPSGWIEIAVTDALHAIFSSNSHLGGRLEVLFQAKLECKEREAEAVIRLANPLLVLFLDANEPLPINELHDFKRSTELDEEESGSGDVSQPTARPATCYRRPFIVDVANLSRTLFSDFVILQPREVDIGYCSGLCGSRFSRVTYWAFLGAPVEPCCSPREFQPLDVLLFKRSAGFLIQRLRDAIATSCGCQV